MVKLQYAVELNYQVTGPSGDFIFNIHAAQTEHQRVSAERLYLSQQREVTVYTDPLGNRYMRLNALSGPLTVRYDATVDIDHSFEPPESIAEVPISRLPVDVLPYLYPSRYCQSDRLYTLAAREFGQLPQGYARVQAIEQWVRQHTKFTPNSSNSSTSALDTLIEQVGVCREFAHLMIALCRASNIPARFVTGTDYGADPALGPPDFHAYVEVFLGRRWYMFDASGVAVPMGFIRLGVGRDAADVSFATIFGPVMASAPRINITALDDVAKGFRVPEHRLEALSTCAAYAW